MKQSRRRAGDQHLSAPAPPPSGAARPHLYEPSASEAAGGLATLFDLAQQPGYYNAERKAALLRRGKRPPHDDLFVDFSSSDMQVELTIAGQSLCRGVWSWQATVAGQALQAAGPWEEVCWNRDSASDYLEIELPLVGGWRLERQMALARHDRLLFIADALLGPDDAKGELHYATQLPLARGCLFSPAADTREGWLVAGARRACVVAPALPEWRAEFCHAELAQQGQLLELRQAALGRNLYAPVWIDFHADRLRRPLTWRRLTVGENLDIVPRDAAAAYRLQSGDEQWLVYRSLDPVGNRSVLGVNTVSSFVWLRFFTSGKTQEIVSIE